MSHYSLLHSKFPYTSTDMVHPTLSLYLDLDTLRVAHGLPMPRLLDATRPTGRLMRFVCFDGLSRRELIYRGSRGIGRDISLFGIYGYAKHAIKLKLRSLLK